MTLFTVHTLKNLQRSVKYCATPGTERVSVNQCQPHALVLGGLTVPLPVGQPLCPVARLPGGRAHVLNCRVAGQGGYTLHPPANAGADSGVWKCRWPPWFQQALLHRSRCSLQAREPGCTASCNPHSTPSPPTHPEIVGASEAAAVWEEFSSYWKQGSRCKNVSMDPKGVQMT